jgi:hypothetical protein
MEVFYSSLQLSLCCSFLLDLLVYDLSSFHDYLSPDHIFLYLPKAFILLVKVYQLVFNDGFAFLLGIL